MKIVRDEPAKRGGRHPVRRSIFSDFIDDKQANLRPLYESREFIDRAPKLMDPARLTPDVQAYIKARAKRINEYILQMEKERDELVEAHHAEIAAGRILEENDINKK